MKTHVSLKVTELARSIDFYSKMFGQTPVKTKPDYAKFDIADPPLNLTLNLAKFGTGGQLSHLGVQVGSTEDVNNIGRRWESEGLLTLKEEQTDCCYALQDKVWVEDPDGAHWEVFTVLRDTEGTSEASHCCDTITSDAGEKTTERACC